MATGSTSSSGGAGGDSGGRSPGQGGATGGTAGTGGGGTACGATGTLTIDASGHVDRACNDWGIEGNWYCFDDNVNPTSCIDGRTPYRASATGMCLSGYTTVDPTFAAYGATLGLSLNSTVGAKAAYDAAQNGVTGFRIRVSGELGGHALKVIFTGAAEPGMSPFVEVNGTGSFDVLIADAVVPTSWSGPEAGERADPSNVWDIRFQIPGGIEASNYNFCITAVTPITE